MGDIGTSDPANKYMLNKVNNRNTKKRCEICSKLTIKTQKQCQWCRSGAFIINFEYISHFFTLFLSLTLNKQIFAVILSLTEIDENILQFGATEAH